MEERVNGRVVGWHPLPTPPAMFRLSDSARRLPVRIQANVTKALRCHGYNQR